MPSRSWMELIIGCLECKPDINSGTPECKPVPITIDRKPPNIQWSNNLESPTHIPSLIDMTAIEKNSVWYSNEELMGFARNEISRRESIGISSTKIMCKSAEEMDVELHESDLGSDIDIGEGVNIEV
jgi:hypothetical protein